MSKKIELDAGRYTILYDETGRYPEKCLRNGKEWKQLVGNNLIFFLCSKLEELERESAFMKASKNLHDAEFEKLTKELELAKAMHREAVTHRDLLNIQLKTVEEELAKLRTQVNLNNIAVGG